MPSPHFAACATKIKFLAPTSPLVSFVALTRTREARSLFLSRHDLPCPCPFTLGHSFLSLPLETPSRASYVAAILAFNLAVWRYRGPVRYTGAERAVDWRISRIAELANPPSPSASVEQPASC